MIYSRARSIRIIFSSFLFAAYAPQMIAAPRPNRSDLTSIEAQARSTHIKDVTYQLKIDLQPELPDYTGEVTTKFKYIGVKEPLTIDFEGGTIVQLSINRKTQNRPDYNGHFLTLPGDSLKDGDNEISIRFKQTYSPAARGLYRFKDPEDGRVYLYTDFEPYYANRFFPCFDQPDLKAKMKLTVSAPQEWNVISNTPEDNKSETASGAAEWVFPETPPMSTYLYALHAGPYHVWKDDKHYPIPLRLFARESLAKYVDPLFWFNITRQGLDYYGNYFDYPYAFKKYDQIIVPDFNAGAMENIAAVTFSERFISRGKMTLDEKQSLANVILHEMAHQWFGDLVTMHWWNDLWLNESFAEFMASQALVAATEFKEAWLDFTAYGKRGAYYEDQLVTTHAIATPVDDTDSAMNNFDGITYGKGASALKQLAFTIGPDAFRDGVRNYLKKYQFSNATLADFLSSLREKAPQFDAKRWSLEWLQSAGLNSVKANTQCSGGKIKSLTLEQGVVSGAKFYRQHATNIGLFDRKGAKLELRKSVKVTYDGPSTAVSAFNGETCPDFVFPNLNDEDFAQIELDHTDLKAALTYISSFPNAELRVILWQTLSQMVRDSKLKPDTYFDLILKQLPRETEYTVKDLVLASFGRRSNLLNYLPAPGTKNSKYEKFIARLETFIWNQFTKAPAGSDDQVLWFESYGTIVESQEGRARFAKLLTHPTQNPKGFVLDQDRKWDIIRSLARQNDPQTTDLLKVQEKADPSQNGRLAAIGIRTASATPAEKKRYWDEIVDQKSKKTEAEWKAMMYEFFPRSKINERKLYAKEFYALMSQDLSNREGDWLRAFSGSLRPLTCTKGDLDQMKAFMSQHGAKLPPSARKSLLIGVQEDNRCIEGRRLSLAQ